jgi:hypothetical protein
MLAPHQGNGVEGIYWLCATQIRFHMSWVCSCMHLGSVPVGVWVVVSTADMWFCQEIRSRDRRQDTRVSFLDRQMVRQKTIEKETKKRQKEHDCWRMYGNRKINHMMVDQRPTLRYDEWPQRRKATYTSRVIDPEIGLCPWQSGSSKKAQPPRCGVLGKRYSDLSLLSHEMLEIWWSVRSMLRNRMPNVIWMSTSGDFCPYTTDGFQLTINQKASSYQQPVSYFLRTKAKVPVVSSSSVELNLYLYMSLRYLFQ